MGIGLEVGCRFWAPGFGLESMEVHKQLRVHNLGFGDYRCLEFRGLGKGGVK